MAVFLLPFGMKQKEVVFRNKKMANKMAAVRSRSYGTAVLVVMHRSLIRVLA